MRFLTRSLAGLLILIVSLALIGLAVATFLRASAERVAAERARPAGEERVVAASVAVVETGTAVPVLTAYGELQAARQLELRAATGGTLLELAPGFRDGGRVRAAEELYRIDPADAETRLALAASDVAAARAEEAEARAAIGLAAEELAVAERQRDLREQALLRAEDLRGRGVGSEADRETAEIALAVADQSVVVLRRAAATAEARIERAEIARDRAEITRAEAARALADTRAFAPFDGLLTEVAALPGRRVSNDERLGTLIDPSALEVAFRVSNAEFARLVDAEGELMPLEVTASLDVDGVPLALGGAIDRAGAAVGAGQTGRLIYASLDADRLGLLRPGDFLTVRVEEPALADVSVLPAAAVSPEGRILLVDTDSRLEEVPVTVLRRQGDAVIVSGAPEGRAYVAARQPQLGPGIRVRPVAPEEIAAGGAETMVRLSPERRAGLIAAVEANGGLPKDAKARLLAALQAEEVPQSMIERLESRRSGG